MNEKIKKLTAKNPSVFEPVVFELINKPDVNLFETLVSQDDFLFDFIKQNVAERLKRACHAKNFRNLIPFLKFYSPFYEDAIASTLARFADEDLTDIMLEKFENGTNNEKAYCAKFFSYIQDPLALEILRKYAFDEDYALANNCAATLGVFKDKEGYEIALKKLNSSDDFEQFEGVNFLISYGDKSAIPLLINIMKKSSVSENIAGQIPYLEDLNELIAQDLSSGLLVLNNIINGLGEIVPLTSVIDFNLWEIFNSLANCHENSAITTVLANASIKFEILTENDEYLFDEDKNTKNEIFDIKKLLEGIKINLALVDKELNENSDFILTALEISNNAEKIRNLLTSSNQTLVLKSAEVLKNLGCFDENSRKIALNNISDEQIKAVIKAI